jgi:hypothetical protein
MEGVQAFEGENKTGGGMELQLENVLQREEDRIYKYRGCGETEGTWL